MPTITRPGVLTYHDALALSKPNADKKIGNNTFLRRTFDGDQPAVAVYLHATPVVTIRADGTYRLSSGGWRTVTTKERINAHSPARLYQHRGEWFLAQPGHQGTPTPFEDGILVNANGQPLLG